jgi:hypothetical protein
MAATPHTDWRGTLHAMWTPEEQLLLATLSRGQRELMIQARAQQECAAPAPRAADLGERAESSYHQEFMRQVDELVFNGDMPLAEKQSLFYGLYCQCCGVFGGASAVFAQPPERN